MTDLIKKKMAWQHSWRAQHFQQQRGEPEQLSVLGGSQATWCLQREGQPFVRQHTSRPWAPFEADAQNKGPCLELARH